MNKDYEGSDLSDRDSGSLDDQLAEASHSIDLEDGDEPEELRCYMMTLKQGKIYHFRVTFDPKSHANYRFSLPLYYARSNKPNPELQRPVVCQVVPPKIMLDPLDGAVSFGKMVIPQIEETIPMVRSLKIRNPDPTDSLTFFIDMEDLQGSRIFSLSKTEGSVPPLEEVDIDITFKPVMPGRWKYSLPVYINADKETKKAEIFITGEGDNPKLLFDRRQIILPVVPVGMESRCSFRILNDGYKSVSVKEFLPDDFSVIPIRLEYPSGNRLGLKMTRIKVDVVFRPTRAISFTT